MNLKYITKSISNSHTYINICIKQNELSLRYALLSVIIFINIIYMYMRSRLKLMIIIHIAKSYMVLNSQQLKVAITKLNAYLLR